MNNQLDSNRCRDCVKASKNCTDPQCSLYRGEQQNQHVNTNADTVPQAHDIICIVCNQKIPLTCTRGLCPYFTY